ncbi:hypothetical protein ACIOHE_31090 [Streptomyces sp. NPDC087851]|uniref:hypothetical protein n=1 Tax=Streptomyces sp. NPDC087851 TaxID=3365810 RepID=UPI00380F1684
MRPGHRLLAGVLAAGALLTAGCAQSVDPIERLGRKAAQRVGPGVGPGAREAPGAPEPVSRAVVVRRDCGRPAPPGRTGARTAKCRGAARLARAADSGAAPGAVHGVAHGAAHEVPHGASAREMLRTDTD